MNVAANMALRTMVDEYAHLVSYFSANDSDFTFFCQTFRSSFTLTLQRNFASYICVTCGLSVGIVPVTVLPEATFFPLRHTLI